MKKKKISDDASRRIAEQKMQIPSDDPDVCLHCRLVRCTGERKCYLERKREQEEQRTK